MKRLILSIFVLIISLICNISIIYATNSGIDIIGPNEVTVGENIQLKSESFIANDLSTSEADVGELNRNDVTTKTTWVSSDPEIATISSTGEVIGKKAGVTTIRASYSTGDTIESSNHGIVVTDKSKNNVNNEKDSVPFVKTLTLLSIALLFIILILIIILIIKNKSKK